MDNLEFWGPHLRGFARAVYRKGRAFGLTYDDICGLSTEPSGAFAGPVGTMTSNARYVGGTAWSPLNNATSPFFTF
ncbi:unnamed protein product, partial [Ectocarpus sp. 4 AP-2014]